MQIKEQEIINAICLSHKEEFDIEDIESISVEMVFENDTISAIVSDKEDVSVYSVEDIFDVMVYYMEEILKISKKVKIPEITYSELEGIIAVLH